MSLRAVAWLALSLLPLALPARAAAAAMAAAATAEAAAFDFDFDFDADMSGAGEELLLLSPRLNQQAVGGLVSAYRRGNQLYLPLRGVAAMLEIGIDLSRAPGQASGFVISQDRPFFLNVDQRDVVVGNARTTFSPDDVFVKDDDIYVRGDLLSTWIPVDFELRPYTAVLDMAPREPTPLQLRLERERRLNLLGSGPGAPNYPRLANEYQLLDGPFISQHATGYYADGRRTPRLTGGSFSTYLSADLAYLETEGYLAGTDSEGVIDHRLTAGRRDYHGRLLGPLGARELLFGDVFTRTLPLVSRNRQVRGARLSSVPLGRANEVQAQTLRGSLPPGWVVELYHDGFLVDYRRADTTGLYVFNDVELHMGNNELKLVFYGPYGERREEVFNYNLAESVTPPGELYYDVNGGVDLFGEPVGSFAADVGVADGLALAGGYATQYVLDEQRQYLTVGARGVAGPVFARADLVQDGAGVLAGTVDGQTKLGPVNLAATHQQLARGFVSEIHASRANQLQTGTGLQTFTVLRPNDFPVDLRFGGEREVYYTGERRYRLRNRAAATVLDTALAHTVGWWNSSEGENAYTDAVFSLSRQVVPSNQTRASGEFSYRAHPSAEASGFAVRLQSNLGHGVNGQLGFTRYFRGRSSTDLGLTRDFAHVALGLNTRYTHPGHVSVFLNAATGLGYVERQQRLYVDALPFASTGAILVKAFVDANGNGAWDGGEQAIQNATIVVNQSGAKVRTGRDGMAFIRDLPPYQPANVSLSAASLEDPAWVSALPGVSVVPRPGRVMEISFPVIVTGDIEGTVTYDRGTRAEVLPGARLELVDESGAVVMAITSEYDGYFLFEKVPAGRYRVRVNADDVARLQGAPLDPVPVALEAGSMVRSGLDFTIKLQP